MAPLYLFFSSCGYLITYIIYAYAFFSLNSGKGVVIGGVGFGLYLLVYSLFDSVRRQLVQFYREKKR